MEEYKERQDSILEEELEQPVEEIEESPIVEEEDVEPEKDTQPEKIFVDGVGELTLDDIKELHKGNMRQRDYTKKTQALAQERQEAKEAMEFWNHVKQNPDYLKTLKESEVAKSDEILKQTAQKLSPEMQQIQDLQRRIALKEIDDEIDKLKNKYSDFDEVKVLTEARNRNIDDLEFIYLALRGKQNTNVDTQEIERMAIEKAKEQLMKEIEQNKDTTTTLIDNKKSKSSGKEKLKLSEKEIYIATQMGLTPEEYQEWKT